MTRYTNFARKRTYVQAGFDNGHDDAEAPESNSTPQAGTSTPRAGPSTVANQSQEDSVGDSAAPSSEMKKKRRRGKARKVDEGEGIGAGEDTGVGISNGTLKHEEETNKTPDVSTKAAEGKQNAKERKRVRDTAARKFASERGRLYRQDQRHANTICFACRETGHPAKDCRKALSAVDNEGVEGTKPTKYKPNKAVVGICYRCGSRRHNLSRCPQLVDPENPLPFVSCFVCSGTGHLAGSCPKNQEKGVYPNGGSCKLCGQTAHLAKDCGLRKQEVASTKLFVGIGQEAGADEDDFHSFKRRTVQINKEEKGEGRRKRMHDVKQGAHSGVVKSFGQPPAVMPRKVVTF